MGEGAGIDGGGADVSDPLVDEENWEELPPENVETLLLDELLELDVGIDTDTCDSMDAVSDASGIAGGTCGLGSISVPIRVAVDRDVGNWSILPWEKAEFAGKEELPKEEAVKLEIDAKFDWDVEDNCVWTPTVAFDSTEWVSEDNDDKSVKEAVAVEEDDEENWEELPPEDVEKLLLDKPLELGEEGELLLDELLKLDG